MLLDKRYTTNFNSETRSARDLLNDYMDIRAKAMENRLNNINLDDIHEATKRWIIDSGFEKNVNYCHYDRQAVEEKMLGLCEFMSTKFSHVITDSEMRATNLFIESSFEMFREFQNSNFPEVHSDADGSYAFVVPMRASRYRSDYGGEVEMISPILRYIPNEYRALFAVGIPPLVLDQYLPDENGKKGYIVLAPIYTDSMFDLSPELASENAISKINDSVDFCQSRLGVKSVGLGAVLPAITRFGQTINNKEVITTTGHAGTVYLMDRTIRSAVDRKLVKPEALDKIGFLGLGSIGRSAAEIITSNFPEANISIYDSNEKALNRGSYTLDEIEREHRICKDVLELINKSNIVVSAITEHIDLDDIDPNLELDLTGKMIIDDSQPGSFDKNQVEDRGGKLVWVVGQGVKGVIQRQSWDIGSLAEEDHLFGCEMEAIIIERIYQENLLRYNGDETKAREATELYALKEPVNARAVRLIGVKAMEYGFEEPAPFQVYREYIN